MLALSGAIEAVVPAGAGIGIFVVWWKLLDQDAAERQSHVYADALFRSMPVVVPVIT